MLSAESYVYDVAGNLSTKTVDGVTTTYGYDNIDQLTSESKSGYAASYTYDANGNRTSKTLNGTTQSYTVDDGDKLTAITQGGTTVKSYTYDAAGRTKTVVTSAGTTTLNYDYEGRITSIAYPSGASNSFTYNGFDTRVGKTDSAGTSTYKRDGVGVTAAVLSDGFASYTSGISERRSGASKFYGTNHLGTTTQETSSAQTITATKTYDAFGLLVSSTGSSASPFGFAGNYGYQEDGDSGLKLLGHRYYDPSTGRFLTRDPIKDGRNWYGYCDSNPHRFVDPLGLDTYVFNGTKLKHYDDKGKLIETIDAVSGKPGTTKKDQDKDHTGPIPEGEYYIDPSEDAFATYNPLSLPGAGFWPSDGWGDRRIPLHPAPGNKTKRGGFHLHGGKFKGSAGCIDIGPNDVPIIDAIGKKKKRQKVIVDYKDWDGKTPGGKW